MIWVKKPEGLSDVSRGYPPGVELVPGHAVRPAVVLDLNPPGVPFGCPRLFYAAAGVRVVRTEAAGPDLMTAFAEVVDPARLVPVDSDYLACVIALVLGGNAGRMSDEGRRLAGGGPRFDHQVLGLSALLNDGTAVLKLYDTVQAQDGVWDKRSPQGGVLATLAGHLRGRDFLFDLSTARDERLKVAEENPDGAYVRAVLSIDIRTPEGKASPIGSLSPARPVREGRPIEELIADLGPPSAGRK